MKSPVGKKFPIPIKVVVALIAVLLSFGAAGFSAWLIAAERKGIEETRLAILKAELSAARAGRLREAWQKAETGSAKLETLFVDREGLLELLNGLDALALAEGIELEINKTPCPGASTSQEKTGPEDLCFSLKTDGSLQTVYRFLVRLEAYPVLLAVEDGSIRAQTEEGVTAQFSLRALKFE